MSVTSPTASTTSAAASRAPVSLSVDAARARLRAIDQEHLLHFYPTLSPPKQQHLLAQISALDFDSIPALVETYVRRAPALDLGASLSPAPYYPHNHTAPQRPWDRDRYRAIGAELISKGKVAAFVVAGGQGSRLGFEGPKGCFPAGAVTGKPLFQIFAEQLFAARQRYHVPGGGVPWYIMTSPLNHKATVAFFEQHAYFGLSPRSVYFFMQGVLPSFDIKTGRILLADQHEIATNPDGHGGAIKALHLSGALEQMQAAGVEHISYFQVDNPNVHVLDPVFLGLHAAAPDSSAEMSSKMLPKVEPGEKLGVFCLVERNGRRGVEVIEYSDLPQQLAEERTADGSLRFLAGSIAIHALGVEFVQRVAQDPRFALPYHRAEKKVPCIDPQTGAPVTPTGNNGVKLERFVFDALASCRSSIVYETDRVEEFAPIKNAKGVDSVESSRSLQTLRAARWLNAAGRSVPLKPDGTPDCTLEISPLTALSADDLNSVATPTIAPGARLAF